MDVEMLLHYHLPLIFTVLTLDTGTWHGTGRQEESSERAVTTENWKGTACEQNHYLSSPSLLEKLLFVITCLLRQLVCHHIPKLLVRVSKSLYFMMYSIFLIYFSFLSLHLLTVAMEAATSFLLYSLKHLLIYWPFLQAWSLNHSQCW